MKMASHGFSASLTPKIAIFFNVEESTKFIELGVPGPADA